ncbi:hypothetical protein PSZ72_24950, partial [Shigella sonnei]|nr:hypothetical protein [Shigella sonnei]
IKDQIGIIVMLLGSIDNMIYAYMYHGNVSGNISINHIINTTQQHNNNANLIFDGSVDIKDQIGIIVMLLGSIDNMIYAYMYHG